MGATFRPMVDADLAEILALNLRAEDIEECRASSGLEPGEALAVSVAVSDEVSVITIDGKIVGLFGLAELTGILEGAAPWMLATDALFSIEGVKGLFAKRSKDVIEGMLEKYSLLSNFVAVQNTKAVSWLEWLGFSFREKRDFRGVEFVRFERRR